MDKSQNIFINYISPLHNVLSSHFFWNVTKTPIQQTLNKSQQNKILDEYYKLGQSLKDINCPITFTVPNLFYNPKTSQLISSKNIVSFLYFRFIKKYIKVFHKRYFHYDNLNDFILYAPIVSGLIIQNIEHYPIFPIEKHRYLLHGQAYSCADVSHSEFLKTITPEQTTNYIEIFSAYLELNFIQSCKTILYLMGHTLSNIKNLQQIILDSNIEQPHKTHLLQFMDNLYLNNSINKTHKIRKTIKI